MAATNSKANPQKVAPQNAAQQFATDVLTRIGASPTAENIRLIGAWMSAEGTKATYNPLATTQPWPGATSFNSVGVQNYPNYSAGVTATAQTLTNGYYTGIVSDLQSGNYTADQVVSRNWDEFNTWGTGGNGVQATLNSNNLFSTGAYGTQPVNINAPGQAAGFGGELQKIGSDVINAGGNPAQLGVNLAGTAASGLAGSFGIPSLNSVTKDVLYALAIGGGGLLILLGFALIGVDLGLSKAKPQTIIVAPLTRRRENRSDYRAGERQAERATTRRAGRQGKSSPKPNNASRVERNQRINEASSQIDDTPPF